MIVRRTAMLAAALSLIAASSAQLKPIRPRTAPRRLPGTAIVALQAIRPENIETHVRFLSHDLLEGRGTGQRGGDIAAEYIAAQFALYGLKPAGENGSYMQKVPMVGVRTLPETTFKFTEAGGKSF